MIAENSNSTQSLHFILSATWSTLVEAKVEDDKKTFNEIMLSSLYDLKKYIARRLKVSIKKGELPANKYQVDEFIDSLFLEAFDHISETESSTEFANWLYAKTDELLADTVVEEEFNDLFYQKMNDIEKPEWEAMQENYTIDAGGDFIMREELDDPSYPDYQYTLQDVFVDKEEESLIQKLDEDLKAHEISNHIKLAVHNLPFDERVPFEMSRAHKIDMEDIALIKNKDLRLVQERISSARKKIAKSFKTRFAIL